MSCQPEEIFREAAYLAYHFHWSRSDIMEMTNYERRKWISEISDINKKINDSGVSTAE